ncbi:MAG TPA: ABC transporter permease [Gaiellaceae bacterium]|nr:ABC transporter permease [Gaiellaceae bacterium]
MSVPALISPRRLAWSRRGRALRVAWTDLRRTRTGIAGLLVLALFALIAIFAPLIANEEALSAVNAVDNPRYAAPSEFPPIGTDNLGRPVWDQIVFGARISLLVGLAATAIAMVIGTLVGVCAGFFGGWVDAVLGRLSEWFLVIPFIPLAIVLAAILGPSLRNIIFVIGITSWSVTALVIRSQVLTLKQRLYVERSRALGASGAHVMARHILPGVMPLVLANTTLTVPIAILSETTLAFLGLGDPQQISWGSMLDDAFAAGALSAEAWWYYVPPGVCVVLVVLSFSLVGRALETILDPRLRDRRR